VKLSSQFLYQPAVFTKMSNGQEVSISNNTNLRINSSLEVNVIKILSIGLSSDLFYQTYPSYLNQRIQPYDSNVNLFIKGNF